MSTKVISILNMKGGVGKTTVTINLAYTLAKLKNKKVLVIDFDPQSNSSSAFLKYDIYEEQLEKRRVISEIFTDIDKIVGPVSKKNPKLITLDDLICNAKKFTGSGYIDLVPSELELSKVLERTGGANIEGRLKLMLENKKNKYDFVLIDCSPTYSVLTNNALKASDYVLIPVKPDPFSARGIPMLLQKISQHNAYSTRDDRVDVMGIVFTMVDDEIRYMDSVKSEILRQHNNVFKNQIAYAEHYSRGLMENKTLLETNAQTQFKDNFKRFTDEFISKIG